MQNYGEVEKTERNGWGCHWMNVNKWRSLSQSLNDPSVFTFCFNQSKNILIERILSIFFVWRLKSWRVCDLPNSASSAHLKRGFVNLQRFIPFKNMYMNHNITTNTLLKFWWNLKSSSHKYRHHLIMEDPFGEMEDEALLLAVDQGESSGLSEAQVLIKFRSWIFFTNHIFKF